MRLNRFLARSGFGSRRQSDLLIQEGAVEVNGEVVSEPGRSVVVGQDRVSVRGRPVALPASCEYVLFHKPRGCLVTRRDTEGRPTVFDQVGGLRPATVAVGRLDWDTAGALLLTDDGELAYRLMHPRYAAEKHYLAMVRGEPATADLERLRQGVGLEDGPTAPARVRAHQARRTPRGVECRVELWIHEGRKHQVKRMFAAVGHPVRVLVRVEFAGLELGDLQPGQWRRLAAAEVRALRALVGLEPKEKHAGTAGSDRGHRRGGRGGQELDRPPRGRGARVPASGHRGHVSRPDAGRPAPRRRAD
jgi:pseudouridine synthase